MRTFKWNASQFILTLPLWLLSFTMTAQEGENMVVNGSFEDAKNSKLRRTGDISRAEGWVSPTGSSADLFSAESKMPDVMTPNNVYGMEEPKDGINYAGIITFSYREKENRTYLTAQLSSPMKKGMRYKVQFYASLAELSKYSANKLGVHFSKKAPGTDSKVPALIMETHVMHPKEEVFDGMYGWDLICGEYTAEGGEKYITIGNFTSDNEVKSDRVKKPRDVKGKQIIAAYYYIDDVSVQLLGPNEQADCNYADEAKTEAATVYQRTPEIKKEMTPEQKIDQLAIYYAGGRYDVKMAGDQNLDKLAEIMKENPDLKVEIIGHSDAEEAEDPENKEIGYKRADYVRSLLLERDLDASRFKVKDVGSEMPSKYLEDTDDDKLRAAKNRRVTFKVVN
ncbi:MAG: OmpA family protein [Brumimicrobium sp.]|nr:OmpA family protein [Brumimicrobium sp.]